MIELKSSGVDAKVQAMTERVEDGRRSVGTSSGCISWATFAPTSKTRRRSFGPSATPSAPSPHPRRRTSSASAPSTPRPGVRSRRRTHALAQGGTTLRRISSPGRGLRPRLPRTCRPHLDSCWAQRRAEDAAPVVDPSVSDRGLAPPTSITPPSAPPVERSTERRHAGARGVPRDAVLGLNPQPDRSRPVVRLAVVAHVGADHRSDQIGLPSPRHTSKASAA